jgi:hypothetical protein
VNRAAARATVVEIFGQPEFFADGWVIQDEGTKSTVTVLFFVSRDGENREVSRVHIPRSEYEYWRAVYRQQAIGLPN